MVRVAVGTLALAVMSAPVSCTRAPSARRVVAPDGLPAVHVSCGSSQGRCFELAGKLCPAGYAISPLFNAEHGNFLIRCRNPSPRYLAGGARIVGAPMGAAQALSGPPRQSWPEPPAGGSLGPTARRGPWHNPWPGEVDLGY